MRKKIIALAILVMLLPLSVIVSSSTIKNTNNEDLDPLVDVSVTVETQAIRYLEDNLGTDSRYRSIFNKLFFRPKIVNVETPNFFVKVFINDEEFTSDVWPNAKFVYSRWSATSDVPDDQEIVDVKIQLWDMQSGGNNVACDISGKPTGYDVELSYNIKTGKWSGDDSIEDPSGYGRLCGCDDGSIYVNDNDCELWFDIYQEDYDLDGIPYWTEVNEYGSNPEIRDDGDPDDDGIPVDWEYKWGYNPFEWDDHGKLDPEKDSINNLEEYLTSEWFSDPFRKDVFVEMDIMGEGPEGDRAYFPSNSVELLNTAFDRQNIVFHLDVGDMGGHDVVPFDSETTHDELHNIYYNYFLHGDEANWRRGVFHYGVVVYYVDAPPGYMFRSNAYQIASNLLERKASLPTLDRDITYASCYMHELGHTFSFHPIPGHDQNSKYPWQLGYWQNLPYKSCMNYGWVYRIVDYSDGSRQDPDIDDWERIDYNDFERER